jgi:hypothetical protein
MFLNVIIAGYASSRGCSFDKELGQVVKYIQNDGVKPDGFTISSLLPLCGDDSGRMGIMGGIVVSCRRSRC